MENQQVINAAAERQANCLLDEYYHPNTLSSSQQLEQECRSRYGYCTKLFRVKAAVCRSSLKQVFLNASRSSQKKPVL